jgi:hypothetical protein
MNDVQLGTEIRRVFERYRATPAAKFPAPLPIERRRLFRQPALVRLSAGGVLLAACLAAAALILQPFSPARQPVSVFASWRSVPTSPDPAMAAWASSHCTNTALPLLIQDQRGAASFFVFQRGTTFLDCIVWTVDKPNESGWYSGSFTGEFNPSTAPVDLWSNLRTEAADQGSVESAVGSAPGAASVIIVTEDGRRIQTSLLDGTFAAWWPTTDIRAHSLREIDAYRSDGILLGRLDFPASSASPGVSAPPDPMPSGPPASAAR